MASIKIRRVDFYPDDWIAGTVGLTHDERSVYISVCVAIWSRGGPADEKYVRQICAPPGRDRHFERALAKLIEKGKVDRVGQKLSNIRAELELNRAKSRTEFAQTKGVKGGRPKGLQNPRLLASEKLPTPPPYIKENPSSSSLPSSARAHELREAAPRTRDVAIATPEEGWRSLGSVLGLPTASPPPPPTEAHQRMLRVQQHMEFLKDHGRDGDLRLYIRAQMSDDQDDAQRMFDLTEARMVVA